jgi:Ca-activated chloride channel homolog
MFQFAHPYWLLLGIPLLAAARRVYGRRRRGGLAFPATFRVPAAARTARTTLALLCPALFLAGLALAVAALARPQYVFSRVSLSADSIAIAMAVDVSGSMEALDFSERRADGTLDRRTRLDVVKETFAAFIRQRPHDLIGLVTFGGFASTRVPLTLDHEGLVRMLQAVEIPRQTRDRPLLPEELMTAVGDGLATALARLREAEVASKIIVLLSDGENNAGLFTPETAAAAAAQLGVRIYTIGAGKQGPAPFLTRDMFGRERIVHIDEQFDEEQLREIARLTDGRYFSALDEAGLKAALEEIDRLETTRVEQDQYTFFRELFLFPLGAGLILILGAAVGQIWAAGRIV